MYFCDTCQAIFTLKRNLTRHISEKHLYHNYWHCAIEVCETKYTRRYNLVNHLEKTHSLSRVQALQTALRCNSSMPDKDGYVDINEDYHAIVKIIAEIETAAQPNIEIQNKIIDQFDLDLFQEQQPHTDNLDLEVISSVSENTLSMEYHDDKMEAVDVNNNADDKEESYCSAPEDGVGVGSCDSDQRDSYVDDRESDTSAYIMMIQMD